ncbi:MAG: hypothetical protein AAF674_22595 [Pseudomonadota bacterium]
MSDGRRVGYGIGRKPADFAEAGLDDLYLDTDRTRRVEREIMVRIGLRSGDTIVVLQVSDLGAGKGLRNFRAAMNERGVDIEVFKPDPGQVPRRGRPPAGKISADDWDRLGNMWRDPASDGGYIIRKACAAMGEDYDDDKARNKVRLRLHRRFGPRSE